MVIYLDSAATTFRKPSSVREAVMNAMRTMSSPGRGGYRSARAAEETLYSCRSLAAEMFGVGEPERVILTMNATHGLNIAIKSLVPRGGKVIISGYEHNAVTRPLYALGADVSVAVSPLFDKQACIDAFAASLRKGADAAICTVCSNVYGYVLPVGEIASLCAEAGIPLIVDASQSAGALRLNMSELGAAFVAMPGHKGLYGPQGTGLLLCGADPLTLIEGGTGSESLRQEMPMFLPDRLEAGTHNMPGIAGLEAGLRYISSVTPERIANHTRSLVRRAAEGLSGMKGVKVYLSEDYAAQLGVLSFTVSGRECEDISEALARLNIAVRAGYHCAPLAHRSGGTLDGGTVRLSVSAFEQNADIDVFLKAMRGIL